MTYEEKLDLVIKAIVEARKLARKGRATIYLNSANGLENLNPKEIYDILSKLEDDEKIFLIHEKPSSALHYSLSGLPENIDYFSLEINEIFDSWYEKYILEHKSKLENLDWINLLKALDVVLDINQQLQFAKGTTALIPSLPQMVRFPLLFPSDSIGTRRIYQQYRWEGAQYLQKMGVILEVKPINDDILAYGDIQIRVDLPKFEELHKQIIDEWERRNKANNVKQKDKTDTKKTANTPTEKPINNSQPTYWITFTKAREILLNDIAQIAKPDFDSENEVVFGFLYANPNKKHKREEIQTSIKRQIGKDLHKIVENLGFTGDLKKVFLDVSKDSICFRNPITKEDLDKLGVSQIRLPVKTSLKATL